MNLYVLFLLNMLMKIKINLFYKFEHEGKIIFFSHNKLKVKLEHRT